MAKGGDHFPDAEQWKFRVQGDWTLAGKLEGAARQAYIQSQEGKFTAFGGAVGFYWYIKGDLIRAAAAWRDELDIILKLEEEEGTRYHKGWFYYQIGSCMQGLGADASAKFYYDLAKHEDELSYGETAKTFPASTIQEKAPSAEGGNEDEADK